MKPLTISEFSHAEVRGHVLVRHLVANAPSHVHYLSAEYKK